MKNFVKEPQSNFLSLGLATVALTLALISLVGQTPIGAVFTVLLSSSLVATILKTTGEEGIENPVLGLDTDTRAPRCCPNRGGL